jgi:hypothetical protein
MSRAFNDRFQARCLAGANGGSGSWAPVRPFTQQAFNAEKRDDLQISLVDNRRALETCHCSRFSDSRLDDGFLALTVNPAHSFQRQQPAMS